MKSGATLITKKRERQVEKHGYSYTHDLNHTPDELSLAAYAYMTEDVKWWPFDKTSFKLGDRIENLTNAGAMIAATIDRLQVYEVGKVYESCLMDKPCTFQVTEIESLESGATLIHFIYLSGDSRAVEQKFTIGSQFDQSAKPIKP